MPGQQARAGDNAGAVSGSARTTSGSAGAILGPIKIYIKHITIRQKSSISVGNIGDLLSIPDFLRSDISFF